MMKHNNMRDDDAYEKKLSRTPVTMDSVPDDNDYKVRYGEMLDRYDAAMELVKVLLVVVETPFVSHIHSESYYKLRSRYKELRDSE